MDKKVVVTVVKSGVAMVVGTGLVAWGTKGIEEVTPTVVEGIKNLLKIKK